MQHLGDGGLDALVGVGDHQLDAAKPAARELAQELGPERLGLGGPNIHAQNLAPAITVDADRDDHRNRHNAPALAHLQVGRVDPQIGPVAFNRATQEGFYFLVDLLAQSADLALGDAGHAHGLDQIIDRVGRDAVYVGFLHHCGQRLLR